LQSQYQKVLKERQARLDMIAQHPFFKHPERFFLQKAEELERNLEQLKRLAAYEFEKREQLLQQNILRLETLNPTHILKRGYSICEKDKKTILSVDDVAIGDELKVILAKGEIYCRAERLAEGKSWQNEN